MKYGVLKKDLAIFRRLCSDRLSGGAGSSQSTRGRGRGGCRIPHWMAPPADSLLHSAAGTKPLSRISTYNSATATTAKPRKNSFTARLNRLHSAHCVFKKQNKTKNNRSAPKTLAHQTFWVAVSVRQLKHRGAQARATDTRTRLTFGTDFC